jgi:hypothetical protein
MFQTAVGTVTWAAWTQLAMLLNFTLYLFFEHPNIVQQLMLFSRIAMGYTKLFSGSAGGFTSRESLKFMWVSRPIRELTKPLHREQLCQVFSFDAGLRRIIHRQLIQVETPYGATVLFPRHHS